MSLTPEETDALAQRERNVARFQKLLDAALKRQAPAKEVALISQDLAKEQKGRDALLALASGAPAPLPVVSLDTVAQILVRLGALERMAHPSVADGPKLELRVAALETARPVVEADGARREAARERAHANAAEGLRLLASAQALEAKIATAQGAAYAQFAEMAEALGEAGYSPPALEKLMGLLNVPPAPAP